MAAATVNSVKRSVIGDERLRHFNITGVSTNTLATGLKTIKQVLVSPGTTVTATAVDGGTVTFTSSDAFTTIDVTVIGR